MSIRVVIPCRNAERTIGACLDALRASRDVEFEIVVVDDSEGSGAGAARNRGAAGHNGDLLVFVDADVVLEPDALAKLIAPIRRGEADATVGAYSENVDGLSVAEAYKQLYLAHKYSTRKGYLANTFWTAIGAVKTEHFRTAGTFSEAYRWAGPEDIELGVALTRQGSRILAVPEAKGRHLASMNIAGLFWNDLRKGTEDVYVHWTGRVGLTDNRHAGWRDIVAVALCVGAIFLAAIDARAALLALAGYLFARRGLLAAFRPNRKLFALAIPLMFLLDLTRAMAVLTGTVTALTARTAP